MNDTATSFRTLFVLGTGTMGQGIAQVAAAAGLRTRVFDAQAERVDGALEAIAKQTARSVDKGKLGAEERAALLGRLERVSSLEEGSDGIDVVVEAVPESMDLKVELLGRVRERAPSHALIGSNTSSLSITELGARIGASDRTVGLHFFNPPR
jgi:3-hydroxybutyryl-CoA dehydrogenase